MSALAPVWDVVERYEALTPEEKVATWSGIALGMADTIHHYIHGKKRGATIFDCEDEACRLMAQLRLKRFAEEQR